MELIKREDEKITVVLDASLLKGSSCLLRMFRDCVMGYKSETLNNDTHWGSAFHAFRSTWLLTGDEDLALHTAEKLWNDEEIHVKDKKRYLTTQFLTAACLDYADKYRSERAEPVIDPETNKKLVEPYSRFSFPLYSTDTVDVLGAGTMDDLKWAFEDSWHGGAGYRITDLKTAMAFNSWAFFDSYFLNPQLIMYRWAIRRYARYRPDSIWAIIDRSPNVGAMIDGVFYRGAREGEKPTVEFKRSKIITFKDWQIEEFERGVMRKVLQLVEAIEKWRLLGIYPDREGVVTNSCDERWGPCKYCQACASPDKESAEAWLEQNFTRRYYNPLTFGGKEE